MENQPTPSISEAIDKLTSKMKFSGEHESTIERFNPTDGQIEWMLGRFADYGYRSDVAPHASRRLAAWSVAHVKGYATRGLIMYGSVGTGKTLFCERILPLLCGLGCKVLTASHICRLYKDLTGEAFASRVHGAHKDDLVQVRGVDLAIDELGGEPKETVNYGERSSFMATFLHERYVLHKQGIKTFITCNLSQVDLASRYDSRVMDRLNEMCYPVFFEGKSARGRL